VIEIKCGEGKIVIGEPCPPIQSFTFPLKSQDNPNNKEEGEEENDSSQPS